MFQKPFCKGPNEVKFRSLAALNKAAVTSLNKDKALRAHKVDHMISANSEQKPQPLDRCAASASESWSSS